jgi:hypothetical protein
MKNRILFLMIGLSFMVFQQLNAQATFKFQRVSYAGALSPDGGASDWTKEGWTNFDPKNAVYPAVTDTTTLNGMLASNPIPGELVVTGTLTLSASKVYLLKGFVEIRAGGKLVIPAGTVIRAQADLSVTPKNYATIVVERGAQIDAQGTAANPIIMTSNKPVGQRDRGNWGGLLIAGKAYHDLYDPANDKKVQMEGFNNVTFDNQMAFFGGLDDNDNSGIVHHLRVEFGGIAFEINKEINGVTLGAVGRGTELHHIQVSFSGDDSFEWFGGTLNSHHLIAFKGTDDDFDTDNGYSGHSQFGIGIRDSAYYDLTYNISGGSTSEGFESDTEATGTANVSGRTTAIFSNFTMIGPVPVGGTWASLPATAKAAFRRGARIRRNSSQREVNSIFMGYRNFIMIDGDSCVRNTNWPAAYALTHPNTAVDSFTYQIYFNNNLIVNSDAAFNTAGDTTANGLVEVTRAAGSAAKLAAIDAWVKHTGPTANCINTVPYTAGTVLVNPSAYTATPDFRPVAGSPALTCWNWNDDPILRNITIVGIKEIEEAAAMAPVYPNPVTNGVLHFGRQVVSYGIFNLSGGLVKYGIEAEQANLDGLAKGIYIIKLDGRAQKFIIE